MSTTNTVYLLHLHIVYLIQIYYICNTVLESEIIDKKVGHRICVKLMLLRYSSLTDLYNKCTTVQNMSLDFFI